MGIVRVNIIIIALTVLSVNYCNTEPSKANDAYQGDISHVTREAISGQENITKYHLDKGHENPFVQEKVNTKGETNLNANRRTLFWPRKKLKNQIKQMDQYKSIELLDAIKERLDKTRQRKMPERKPRNPRKPGKQGKPDKQGKPGKPGKPDKQGKPDKPGKPGNPRKPSNGNNYEVDMSLEVNINEEDNNEERLMSRYPKPRPGLKLYNNGELIIELNNRLNKGQPLQHLKSRLPPNFYDEY
ncbi:translation initiation factor IF-2 [Bicyclus anynana]|uniref:Translation initiation factor IF-2 n=1 Tax=Bicyclus anynana TaxID=110368 RepID=A0A6J1MZ99_BICAN|nr:translation initiation factor IF-2 [Bicyclus anynana]